MTSYMTPNDKVMTSLTTTFFRRSISTTVRDMVQIGHHSKPYITSTITSRLPKRLTRGRDQRSYSTPGPVSTWVGDRLPTDKPSRYVTSHPGQLSLAIPPWVGAMSTSESWEVNGHTARYNSPVSVVSQCKLVSGLAEGEGNGDQRRPMGLVAQEGLYFTLLPQEVKITLKL